MPSEEVAAAAAKTAAATARKQREREKKARLLTIEHNLLELRLRCFVVLSAFLTNEECAQFVEASSFNTTDGKRRKGYQGLRNSFLKTDDPDRRHWMHFSKLTEDVTVRERLVAAGCACPTRANIETPIAIHSIGKNNKAKSKTKTKTMVGGRTSLVHFSTQRCNVTGTH